MNNTQLVSSEPEDGMMQTEVLVIPEEEAAKNAESMAGTENAGDTEAAEEGQQKESDTESGKETDTETETEISAVGGYGAYLPFIGAGAVLLTGIGIAAACLRTKKKRKDAKKAAMMERKKREMAGSGGQRTAGTVQEKQEWMEPAAEAAKDCMKTETVTRMEPQPLPRTEEEQKLPGGIYVGKVHHIGRRSSQQDSFGISQDGTRLDTEGKGVFAIVADGMGGLSNGGEVSTRVTISMLEAFESQEQNTPGDGLLLALLNKANTDVNQMLGKNGQRKSGSTVVAVLIRDDWLYWIAVGDSHIYLYRDDVLMQINREHVYSVELDEMAARGDISAREAAQDPQRRALTSFIGIGKLEKIDRNIRPLKLQSQDRVLLMTDGVFGTLSEEEITAAMRLPVSESGVAIRQMIQAKNKETQDNYTALILEYR